MTHRLTSSLLLSAIIVFLFLFTIVYSAALYDGATSNVTVLTARDVNVLERGEIWLVNICPNDQTICQEFEPVYERAASLLKGRINVGAIVDERFAETRKVTNFPSVRLYRGIGKPPITFDGVRDTATVLRIAGEYSAGLYGGKTTNVRVLTRGDFGDDVLFKRKGIWLINFCPDRKIVCQEFETVYERVASLLKETINVAVVVEERVVKEEKLTRFPTVKLYRNLRQKPLIFHGKRDVANLIRFVEEASADLSGGKTSRVKVLTAEQFNIQVLHKTGYWLINFCPDQEAVCQEFEPVYERLPYLGARWIKVGRVVDKRLARDQNVDDFPTVRLYLEGRRIPCDLRSDAPRDTTTLLLFVERCLSANRYERSITHVDVLTGKAFQSRVVDSDEAWLINFCPYEKIVCHEFAFAYNTVASRMKEKMEKINVGAIINERFFPDNVKFAGSPMVVLYRAAGIEPVTYRGPFGYSFQDATRLLQFISRTTGGLYGVNASNLITLTAHDFKNRVVERSENWLIIFCPDDQFICHGLLPEYEALASLVKNKVKVGVVVDERLAKKQNVTSFPTVELYLVGLEKPIRYKGLGKNDKSLTASISDFVKEEIDAFSKMFFHENV